MATTLKPISTAQIAFIKRLMARHNLLEQSAEFALQYSHNRTSHISELNVSEANLIIQFLNGGTEDRCNVMRQKIISMAREMGWTKAVPNPFKKGEMDLKADMEHIHSWCMHYGYLHKPLNNYTFEELPKLVSQFGRLHEQFLNEL